MKKRKAGKMAPWILYLGIILFFGAIIASQLDMPYLTWFVWCLSANCAIGSMILLIKGS